MADKQAVEITGLPEGHPPLMIFVNKMLNVKDYARLRDTVSQAIRERRMVVFEPGIDVYQMIDGRWQSIHPGTKESKAWTGTTTMANVRADA